MPDESPQDLIKYIPADNSLTRYERVKQILNVAQGSANPSYQGYHQFWNLPIAEFLEIVIYGVRMIAPMPASRGAEHPLSAKPINDFRDDRGIVKARKNINALTPEELARFRNAVAQMKSLDNHFKDERSFGYWARIHANACQHGWEEFLPWHRPY